MEHQYPKIGRALRRLSPRHAILLAIEQRIFADSSQVVLCPSHFVANEIASRHGVPRERLEVIPYGVDLERFDPSLRDLVGSRVRAELGAGAEPIWLLVGSGWRRKGLDTALRALALARSPDTTLWIAGSDAPGAWQARAAALGLAARVHFLGHRRDVERLYAAADALVLPTRYDAFGAVCLEAAAAALPVVTSRAAGAAELLAAGALVVADADDAAGFAAALAELADPAVRRARGAAGRAQAERHDVATRVAAVRALYARILLHRRGGSA
jgi:UDP-glucose:(heptosyl)LPS alpha-1,3-glucosyltransferase